MLLLFTIFMSLLDVIFFFFFNDTATTEIYTLSLHDALPISRCGSRCSGRPPSRCGAAGTTDRKSTRLNSSHSQISYAVFCLKKKKTKNKNNDALQTKERQDSVSSNTTHRDPPG